MGGDRNHLDSHIMVVGLALYMYLPTSYYKPLTIFLMSVYKASYMYIPSYGPMVRTEPGPTVLPKCEEGNNNNTRDFGFSVALADMKR